MSGKLTKKVAVVTGASKGIGAAIATRLAAEGAAVVVNFASSRAGADRVVAAITAAGGRAIAVGADVSKPAEVERLFAAAREAFGPVDILVNNAGIYDAAPLGEITAEHFHRHFDLNVLGLILATQEALRHFAPAGGAVINVSSVVSKLAPENMSVYSATKAAVDALTKSWARELAPRKIRVNSVNPGLIATEGTRERGFVKEGEEGPAHLGLMGQPDDIAAGVAFLASDDSRWMNGETLYLAGAPV